MKSVFITCAVTGSGDTVGKSDKVPSVRQKDHYSFGSVFKVLAPQAHCYLMISDCMRLDYHGQLLI